VNEQETPTHSVPSRTCPVGVVLEKPDKHTVNNELQEEEK
jgi:hypothetical protein